MSERAEGRVEETEEFYAALSPGIRGAARFLHRAGWRTTVSVDGSLFSGGMECAWEDPMVVVASCPSSVVDDADRVWDTIGPVASGPVQVEASYSPNDGVAIVIVHGRGLLDIDEARAEGRHVTCSWCRRGMPEPGTKIVYSMNAHGEERFRRACVDEDECCAVVLERRLSAERAQRAEGRG